MDEKEREELLKEIEDYTKKIKEDPNNASYYNNRGIAYSNLEDYEKAIQDYNRAIELNPNDDSVYFNRGTVYYCLKEFEKAIENYNKGIELNPNDNFVYFNRGNIHFKLEKYEKAIQDYNKAIELEPNDASYYNNRGTIFTNLEKYEEAIQDYNRAIELEPNDASTYFNRGIAFANLNNYDKAIENLNKTIELNPNDDSAYFNRGTAFINLSDYEKAINDFNKAIELEPNNASYYNNRGSLYINQRNYNKAIKDFSKAIELNPIFAFGYSNLGNLYNNLNDYEKAIEILNKAIELDPNFSDACNVIEIISTTQNNKKVIKFGKNGSKQNIKESKEPIYSIIFNQINSLYITGNFKKIKDELLPKIQDFKKESEKQKNNSEIDKLTKKVELIESIFKDEPQKLEGYLIFADILGWKGIWKKQDKKDIANVTFFIKNILEKEFDRELKEKKYNISLISDTFIVFSKEWELSNKLSKKLIELCLENDLVIRGAISYGECYNKDTVYVGPAVDEAASWHDEGEEIGIFCTPSAKQEIINNDYDLPEDFIKLKSGEINTFFINWYNKETKKKFDELFSKIDKSSIKVYLKYLNTEKKFDKYLKEEK